MPRRRSHAQIAVVIQLLPAWDAVPPTNSEREFRVRTVLPRNVPNEVVAGTGLLTCGEFPRPAFPLARANSGRALIVAAYSCGAVAGLHRLPEHSG